MDAGLENEYPHRDPHEYIGCDAADMQAVERKKRDERDPCNATQDQPQLAGVEKRNDDDGPEIVEGGESQEKHLERYRRPAADKRERAESEGDVGGCRYGPAPQEIAIAPVDGAINECGNDHPAECCKS